LVSNEFQGWLAQNRQTLFCPGIPGAGKTIIASIVIEYLLEKFENDATAVVVYIYCNFQREQDQKPEGLLASLLRQLLHGRSSIPEGIRRLYRRYEEKRIRPSFQELSHILHSVLTTYSRAFIIIDAIDECRVSDGGRNRFLTEIFNLQEKTGVNLFVTSRHIPEIENKFEGSIAVEIRADNEDVQRYLDGNMAQLPGFVLRNEALQAEIKSEIAKTVCGMYA
jgi:Cdc6-like AAA superfamily ATPase